MEQPNLKLWFEGGDESLSIRKFTLKEAMNEVFTVDLLLRSPSDDLDLEAFVGRAAKFEMTTRPGRKLECVVQSMTLARAEATGLSTYRMRLVPRLWLLTQRTNNRIFQHLSIPDILREVLADARVTASYRLDETAYPKHEYRTQYEETDFAFLSRLCEEAGLAFFFDEESQLTFAEAPQSNTVRALPVPYHPSAGAAAFGERFHAIELRDEVRPGRYTLRDHDFRRAPHFELFGKEAAEHDLEKELELYHYRPGSTWIHKDGDDETPHADDRATVRACPDEGAARAKRKLESIRAGKLEVSLQGDAFDLAPGVCFKVANHPHRELGPERALLVVAWTVSGEADHGWSASVTAHFADLPYRPPHRTRKPRASGIQSAIVVGPAGEEIHTDEFGRVRVQFHWDRKGSRDEQSSSWVRVSQGWAGGGQGMIVLPRIGQEVLVGYLEGDLDRPIVMGRTFNATAPVPHALPANKTKSAWRSESSPRSGGFNEIMMEDANGDELLQLHAQKDMQKRVNNNANHSIGNSLSEFVGNNKELLVGSSQMTNVAMACMKTVGMLYRVEVPPGPATAGARAVGAAAAEATTATVPAHKEVVSGEGPDPTFQEWVYGHAKLTAGGSSLDLEKDITIKTKGNIRIESEGTVTIVGKRLIELNP